MKKNINTRLYLQSTSKTNENCKSFLKKKLFLNLKLESTFTDNLIDNFGKTYEMRVDWKVQALTRWLNQTFY